MTRVSIGLPVFNAERYLADALDDVLAQTHRDLEIVISDNGSTDATQQICEAYAAKDDRIRYLRQAQNRGAAWNHNEVVRKAQGPYFRWYSYDDRLDPRCIEACAQVLDARPEIVLAWPLTTVIDANGDITDRYRDDLPFDNATASRRLRSLLGDATPETLLHMCYPVYGVTRLEVFRSTHLLQTMPGSDTVLLCELALRGRWQLVPEWLFFNRRHEESSAIEKSPEEISAWFDPAQGSSFPMPQTRLFIGYLRAVLTSPLTVAQRLASLEVVMQWLVSHRRLHIILGELKIRARQFAARRRLARPRQPTRMA